MTDSGPPPRGRPFQPGQSGNPRGRPKGSRNQATIVAESLLDGEATAITRKLIEKALEGDRAALRLSLERLVPPKRQRYAAVDLEGELNTAEDAKRASKAVLTACTRGEISLEDASQLMSLIECHIRILDVVENGARLAALERVVQK